MKQIALILTALTIIACANPKTRDTRHETRDTRHETRDTIAISSDKSDYPTRRTSPTTPNSSLLTPNSSLLLGKFDPATDSNFVVIPQNMTTHRSIYCNRQAFDAYLVMRDSALKEGITLTIVSATRNFDRQRQIWERKWNSYETRDARHETRDTAFDISRIRSIMRYSSMPGTSRHHWGTELDFISTEPDFWTHGEGLRIYNWLCANAPRFGFFQPYTDNPARTGYAEERWHWSYAPLSRPYLEAYQQKITAEDITGFSGSYLVDSLNIIESHVFGIEN